MKFVVTIEEGVVGGFGTQVLHYLAGIDFIGGCRVRVMTLPDRFIGHGTPAEQYADAGLSEKHIVAEVMAAFDRERRVLDFKTQA